MAESVDALVSNTSGATHPGSIPGLGTTEKGNFLRLLFISVTLPFETKQPPHQNRLYIIYNRKGAKGIGIITGTVLSIQTQQELRTFTILFTNIIIMEKKKNKHKTTWTVIAIIFILGMVIYNLYKINKAEEEFQIKKKEILGR